MANASYDLIALQLQTKTCDISKLTSKIYLEAYDQSQVPLVQDIANNTGPS